VTSHVTTIVELDAAELAEWCARTGRPAMRAWRAICQCGEWESEPSTDRPSRSTLAWLHRTSYAM